MTHSIISKALVTVTLLISAYTSVSVAGQDLYDSNTMEAQEDNAVITVEQQQEWEIKMVSLQQNIVESLQKDRDNMMLLNDNIDYQTDAAEISAELGSIREHIVQN